MTNVLVLSPQQGILPSFHGRLRVDLVDLDAAVPSVVLALFSDCAGSLSVLAFGGAFLLFSRPAGFSFESFFWSTCVSTLPVFVAFDDDDGVVVLAFEVEVDPRAVLLISYLLSM